MTAKVGSLFEVLGLVVGGEEIGLKLNKKLTCNQSAFQKLCSTITSLLTSTDNWYENMDSRKINLTLFLDLKKHSIQLRKSFVRMVLEDLQGIGLNRI